MNKKWIMSFFVVFSLTALGLSQGGTSKAPVIEKVNNNTQVTDKDVIYQNEISSFESPEKKIILKLMNDSVKKFNARDKEEFLNLFIDQKSYAPVYEYLTKGKNGKIVNVSNPRFRKENDLITVTVDKTCSIDNECGGMEYSFMKVGDTWKLVFID